MLKKGISYSKTFKQDMLLNKKKKQVDHSSPIFLIKRN